MNLIQESYQRLFPQRVFCYETNLEYNRKLGNFNANIKMCRNKIEVKMNLQWKDIDDEIKIGLIQLLLLKVFKKKLHTCNIDLYNCFIKKVPTFIPKTKSDPLLKDSFVRVNDLFFDGKIDPPNLIWGRDSFRKLASYNFHNDMITISTIFQDSRTEVIDYLMYHELLHKYHQFRNKNGRSFFHTSEFRADEACFPQQKVIEKEISRIIKDKRKGQGNKRKGFLDYFIRGE